MNINFVDMEQCRPWCILNQAWTDGRISPRTTSASGKRPGRPPVKVAAAGENKNRSTLLAWDRRTGRSYLVDTGADVSVFPASLIDKKTRQKTDPLVAANGSIINTFG